MGLIKFDLQLSDLTREQKVSFIASQLSSLTGAVDAAESPGRPILNLISALIGDEPKSAVVSVADKASDGVFNPKSPNYYVNFLGDS
jgi:hypothetical protein